MARFRHSAIVCAVLAAVGSAAHAQSLNQPSPVARVMDAVQFGMPRDAKYVLCDGDDCPDRTTKTLTAPKPIAQAPAPLPQPQSIAPPVELVLPKPAPTPPKPAPAKKKHIKRKPSVICDTPAKSAEVKK